MIKTAIYILVAKVLLIAGAIIGIGVIVYQVVMNWDMSLLKMPDMNPLTKFSDNILQKVNPTESLTRMVKHPEPDKQWLSKIQKSTKYIPTYKREAARTTKYKLPKYTKPKSKKVKIGGYKF